MSASLSISTDRNLEQWAAKKDVVDEEVNGEMVEKKTRDQQQIEFIKAGVGALGFVMAVVGIWGDGA